MATTYDEFCAVAAELIADESCAESRARAAVSRAYYGMYHAIQPVVDGLPVIHRSVGESVGHHRDAIDRLAKWDCPLKDLRYPAAAMSKALAYARTLRNRADYELGQNVSRVDAEAVLERAKRAIRFAQTVTQARAAA